MRRVRYYCSCGLSQPLSKLYFCRHCLDLRCGFCVSHEVDSHYCPNCLENMPSAEARLKKNRCANCFDCPSCGHTLSTRATSMQLQAPTEDGTNVKIVTKKLYYLVCAFCRWTSRDAGLPDQVFERTSIISSKPSNIQFHRTWPAVAGLSQKPQKRPDLPPSKSIIGRWRSVRNWKKRRDVFVGEN